MEMNAGNLGGSIIRYIDPQNWYWFEAWRKGIYPHPNVKGADQAPAPIPGALWERKENFQDGKWHTYRIKAEGENVTVRLDKQKILVFI